MKILNKQSGFSIIEAVISLAGAGILFSAVMGTVSLVHRSSQKTSEKGKQIDYANLMKTKVNCAQTLRSQTSRCGTGRYIYLRNTNGENMTNRTANGSMMMDNLWIRARCSNPNGAYQLDIEHQFSENGSAPSQSNYIPMFKIPMVCEPTPPTPPAPPAPQSLTPLRIPGGCFKARHGGSGSSAHGMNGSGNYPVECSFEMDLSTHSELRPNDIIVSMQISYTTGAAPFNCHVGGNCRRGNVHTPANPADYMPHSIWGAADNMGVVFNTDSNGDGPILISGDPIIYPAERATMRNFIRSKANQGGFRCFYESTASNYQNFRTETLNVAGSQTITLGTDTFLWNADTKRLTVSNRRFDPNQFNEDMIGSSRWDYAAGACLGDFTVTLTVNSP